jgi:hypothetical protein
VNPKVLFEVFIHKVDGLSDDHKHGAQGPWQTRLVCVRVAHSGRGRRPTETQRVIQSRAGDDLTDAGLDNLQVTYYMTSIYDHSIFEAFSKVIQKLIPQLPTLENLLTIFCAVRPCSPSPAAARTHACMFVCFFFLTCVYVCVCPYTYACMYVVCLFVCARVCVYMYVSMCVSMCVCVRE